MFARQCKSRRKRRSAGMKVDTEGQGKPAAIGARSKLSTAPPGQPPETDTESEMAGVLAVGNERAPGNANPGRPLSRTEREHFESRFEHDFSQVRIHTGADTDEQCRQINALAFTRDQRIAVRDGTKIDIHLDQIEDEMLTGNDVLIAHKQSFIGKGQRITLLRMDRQTTPHLFAAKFQAIKEQTRAANALILASMPAVFFVLGLSASATLVPTHPAGAGRGLAPGKTRTI